MPRNLVKISREQQELLDRKESWHCPSAGSQTAYATIPVKVREDLKSFMNKPPGETQNGIASDHITVSDDTDDSSESEDESHRSVHSAADNQFEQTRANSQDAGGTQFATNEEGEESDAENLSDEESASCSMASLQTKSENYGGSKHRAMTNEEDDPDGVSEPSPAANRHRTFPTSRVTAPLISQQRASENGQGKSNLEAAANRTSASLTKVELQSATRRAPPPDFYPSSAPDQDLELDELHAEGDEVEHDEGEEVQIPQSSQVLPSTAPTKPRLIQVERSPFNDTNLIVQADKKTFLISRPSSAKNIEDLYESPSSDPVVVATYENKSQETETTESALDNEQHTLGSREKDDSMTGFTQGILPQEIRVIDNGDSSESDEDIRSPPSLTYNADKPSPLLNTSVQPLSRKSKPCVALTPILDSISSRLVTPEVMCALAQPTIPGKENDAIPSPSVPASLYRKPTEMVTNLSREQTPLMPSPPKRLAAEKAIQQEAFTRRNTKKMARAARHKFNEDCLPVERNLPPTNLCPLIPRTPPVEARPIITQDTRHSTSPRRDLPLSQENRPSQSQRTPPVQAMPQDARPLGVDQSNKTTSDQQRITPERASYSNSNRSRHTSESPDGSQGDLTVLDAHQQFLAAYPGYAGSRNNFTWALVYIEWLRKANQVLPGFLFDDFIRVISYEYITYVHDCQRKDLQPLTGWHFYDEKVDEPKFTKSVIQRKNLSDALLTLDQRHVEKIRAQFSATSEPDDSRVRGSETPSTIQPVRQPSTADASSSKRLGDTAPSGMNEKSPASKVTLPSSPIILQNSPLHQRTSSAKAKTSAPTRSTPAKSTPTRLTRAQQTPKSPILGIDSDSKWINAIKSLKQLKEKRDIDESRIRAKTSDNGKSISEASVTKRKPEHSTEDISHPAKKPRVDRKSLGSTTSLRTPFLAIPQPASVSEQSETTSRVTGGLNNIKKGATFKDMLEGIQQSGGLKSRLSTPSSTAAKRFCTKTKQDAEVMVMEPKTQAWNYD
ncbi:hypothetical protein BJ875DRAFT_460407 [Amylocarpus encephaloides]|uniref:Uncharacterized protein n=1 Tax=Amylocarpus encephaloides TaxID=45428 RepID=A0A9P8C658_9HELO|nr:hypothetical protein BJ875DRAFT_460407 [Amylocarpus encephaloides]